MPLNIWFWWRHAQFWDFEMLLTSIKPWLSLFEEPEVLIFKTASCGVSLGIKMLISFFNEMRGYWLWQKINSYLMRIKMTMRKYCSMFERYFLKKQFSEEVHGYYLRAGIINPLYIIIIASIIRPRILFQGGFFFEEIHQYV